MRNPQTAKEQLDQANDLLNDFIKRCAKMQETAKKLEPMLEYAGLKNTNVLLQKEALGFMYALTFIKEVAMCETKNQNGEQGFLF